MINETKCHLCGSSSYRVKYGSSKTIKDFTQAGYKITDHSTDGPIRIISCLRCGLSFLNPKLDNQTILDNYASMTDEKYIEEEEGRRKSARSVLNYLKKFKNPGRLLDVGCASGFLLDEAKKLGWEVYGVELSQWAAKYAHGKLQLNNVIQGTLKEANFQNNFFDAVLMIDVIEHLSNPKAMLYRIRQLLKPSGVLCCSTPDIDSTVSKILKAKWWGIKQSHLYYFNKSTLSKLLVSTGFFPMKIRSHARTFSLGYWFSNLSSYTSFLKFINPFLKKNPKLKSRLLSLSLGDQIEIFARKSRQIKYLPELEMTEPQAIKGEKKKIVAVLPAYNAEETLKITVGDIPRDTIDDIILVDDASKDNTVAMARQLGLHVFRHNKNKGYGGNQKTCYRKALEMGADIIIMVHPDYQYDPKAIPRLIEPLIKGKADAVFGSRMMKGSALEGGMPMWKHSANILLTALENVTLGIYLTEYHTGLRAYSKKYLENINFEANSNNFVFDTEIIVQGALKFMRLEEVPIKTRYFDEASSIQLWPCIVYGLGILKTLLKVIIHRTIFRFKQFE
ncbi:MAG: methyltransferase domain-containing protein [Candidatus Aceula meridiana]|nr:methyltransferase domain-containing protein [Candidatus Aceula meridiana]